MKKFVKLTLAVALLFIGASAANAQQFGRVDLTAIIPNMPEYQEADKNLAEYGKDLQDQLEQIQVEFNNRLADFEKNQESMNPTVKQMKQAELQGLQQRYGEFQQIAQQDFQKKQQELALPIQEKLDAAIAKVAKAAGYSAVFDTMAFVYYDEAQVVDINGAVKKELGIE